MRWFSFAICLFLLIALSSAATVGGEKDKKEPPKTPTTDPHIYPTAPNGKEVKMADWRFSVGTRHFTLSPDAPMKPKAKDGPEYLEFRAENSTTYQNGILTLIPLTSIRKIDYDREKKTVAVVVVNADGKDETLAGTTKFVGINKLTLEGDAVLDGLGSATVKFQGGIEKGGLQGIRFPNAKAAEPVKGMTTVIVAQDKEKTKHTANDLAALYLVDGNYRVLPHLHFKKTVKIDLDKIASMRFIPSSDKKQLSSEYEVTLRDGAKHVLTLLSTIETDKKKGMTFAGLIGRVPVGYKLFPAHTILELRAGEDEKK